MKDTELQLGPFELIERIGEGGMGVVWRGRHREMDVPVAVKAIRGEIGDRAVRQFHEEVQAHGGLQHPSVAYLFEYGQIDDQTAAASGEFSAGSPYVVMELADRGTVRDAMPVECWETVCRLLVQTLDALAYSHAQGVVHRDLKPENVLLFDEEGGDWRAKLADFGIAHALGDEREAQTDRLESAAGTPLYMAPEQAHGDWRSFGPWTDLYALGCIAWELVCGRPPFGGDSFLSIVMSHQTDERPPLDPQFPVPDELEGWIHRAMAVDPERRFRRAADAVWNLPRGVLSASAPETPQDEGPTGETTNLEVEETIDPVAPTKTEVLTETIELEAFDDQTGGATLKADEAGGATLPVDEAKTPEVDGAVERADRLFARSHPPVRADWQRESTNSMPAPLVGAGLGLFGLREPPFVNRHRECELIWQALHDVVEERTTRMVLLTGEAGTGKSRLAEWMATRAHEVGAARVVRAVHTPSGGPTEGLRGALERVLKTVKRGRAETYEHLCETLAQLSPDDESAHRDARPLTEYLRPTDDAGEIEGPRYRFSSADERRALLIRTLDRLAQRRPLMLWLDDLQWGPEAVGMLEQLSQMLGSPPQMLVVATVRSDVVADSPELQRRLEELHQLDWSRQLDVEPLSRNHQRELLDGLLPLDDTLAEMLAERTEGHPLFAMQLLGHWIEGGDIEITDEGFGVPQGQQVELPDDIHDLWSERIERLLEGYPDGTGPEVLEALELAAALGREVDAGEWEALLEEAGVIRPVGLVDRLVERGLADRTADGWAFAHGLLVEWLDDRAERAGRRRRHHRLCADMLERVYPDNPERTAARRADHRQAAGQLDRAIDAIWEEVERKHSIGDADEYRAALERHRELLEVVDAPTDDPRVISNDLNEIHCRIRREGADLEEVLEWLADSRGRAERIGDDRLAARAWNLTSNVRRKNGAYEEAVEAARRAAEHARGTDDPELRCSAIIRRGWGEYHRGELARAEKRFADGLSVLPECGDTVYEQLLARRGLAVAASGRGDMERARSMLEDVLAESRAAGFRSIEMGCLNSLAEIARFEGDSEWARQLYQRFEQLGRELNRTENTALALLNQALVELDAEQFDVADEPLEQTDRLYREIGHRSQRQDILRLARLVRQAGLRDWARFDELFERYADGWPQDARVVKDHPWLLEMTADYAADAGKHERGRRARRLARDLWKELGDEKAVERLDEVLDG